MRRSKAPSYSKKVGFVNPVLKDTPRHQGDVSGSLLNSSNNPSSCPVSEDHLRSCNVDVEHRNIHLRIFSVVYGKRSNKKHKTWEGDGTVEIGLKSVTLKDENGKVIGHASNIKTVDLDDGSRICIGNKEVELIELKENGISKRKRPLESEDNIKNIIVEPKKKKSSQLLDSSNQKPDCLKKHSSLHGHYEELILPRPTDEHQWVFNSDCLPVTPVSVPGHLCRVLRPHQREGVVFLYKCISGIRSVDFTGAILADEMGLGKTLQCISLVWTLLNSGPYGNKPLLKRILVVVPSSLTQNWNNEFIRWIGSHKIRTFVIDKKNRPSDYLENLNIPVLIISYEMFMRGYSDIKNIDFDLVICDEGHRLKNCSIKTTTALNSLPCKRRILLTGTPIQNDLQEFFALVDLVNHGILGNPVEFKRKYIDPITASREPKATEEVVEIGEKRGEELNRLTSSFILRRTQSVIDKFLPVKNDLVVFCEPTSTQRIIYSAATSYWLEQYEEKSSNHEPSEHLSVIHALKKICNHPILVQNSGNGKYFDDENLGSRLNMVMSELNLSSELVEGSGKLKVVNVLLKSLANTKEKVVLVSNFTQTLDLFEKILSNADYKYLRFDGSTPSSERMAIVNRFNASCSDIYVLLLSSKAGGVGLNLIGGSRLVLYDSDWNPATDLQAMARIWREGQKRPVYIYRLLTSGTIEEKIFQRQLSKAGLSESIVDPSATSNVKLSVEEIKDLFSYTGVDKCMTHVSLQCECEGDGSIPVINLPQSNDNREAELMPENSTSLPSLRMNQLFQWEHHAKPVAPHILEDMGFSQAIEEINYVFKNKTQ